jgi:hypothetical protein
MRHVWRKREMHTGLRYTNLKEIYDLEHLCTSERMILKLILKKYSGKALNGFTWLQRDISDEDSNEEWGYIKQGEFLNQPRNLSFSRRILHHGVSDLIYIYQICSYPAYLVIVIPWEVAG